MKDYIIETNQLTKCFGKKNVVDHVSLKVEKGSIYGLIGQNGAGKTTMMKMICGLIECSEGEISLFGKEMNELQKQQRRVGTLIESPGVFGDMTAFENMKTKAIGMGVYDKDQIREILEFVGLSTALKKKVKNFSLGMKQRLGIGLALIGSPDILILDEPINGLDPQGIIEVRQMIQRLNKERNITVLISSHILEELYKVVTHIGIIEKGELMLQISKQELDERCKEKVEIVTKEIKNATVILEKLNLSNYTVVDGNTIYVQGAQERTEDITKALVMGDVPVKEIKIHNDNLEEFFLSVVDKEVISC